MKNNKGFTLIELVIVVAIIAISLTFVSESLSSIFSIDNKKCIRNIDVSLSRCRVSSISREGNVYMKIVQKTDGIYCEFYENGSLASSEKAGKTKQPLTIASSTGSVTKLTQTNALYLSFHRDTGSFMSMSGAKHLEDASVTIKDDYCEKISAIGPQETISVVLVPSTGKHNVEKGGEQDEK